MRKEERREGDGQRYVSMARVDGWADGWIGWVDAVNRGGSRRQENGQQKEGQQVKTQVNAATVQEAPGGPGVVRVGVGVCAREWIGMQKKNKRLVPAPSLVVSVLYPVKYEY